MAFHCKNSDMWKRGKIYRSYYMDRFFSLKCAADLMALDLFPNAKEVTESFAAYRATKYLPVKLDDKAVTVVCVGDGTKPRTAATFAFRSGWQCYSVDPVLKPKGRYRTIQRLTVAAARVEDFPLHCDGPVVICLVHSHASLEACMDNITGSSRHIVTIPCCVNHELRITPDQHYVDDNIWSPMNTVKVWTNI